jgi:fermentation-respiration switch protein FrsA (DUF1100 family)
MTAAKKLCTRINHHWLPKLMFVGLMVLLLPGCVNRMFYYPNRVEYREPESIGGGAQEVFFRSGDGTRLHGWFVAATTSNVHGTVVHFHGNAQNLTAHSSFVDWLPAEGFNVFLFDYRGYGKSEGRPSREGLFMDGVAALREVRGISGVDTNRIIMIGQSLGGTTALAIAGRHPELRGQALIIDSAFYSYRRIVRDKIAHIPLLSLFRVPLSYVLISNALSPEDTLADIAPVPILFLHGTADLVIPHHHSEMLYAAAGEPKQLILIPGGRHIDAMIEHRAEILPRVIRFMKDAASSAAD